MNIGITPGVIIITLIEAEIFHKHLYKCWYQTIVIQRLIIPTCYLPLTFVKDIFLITKLSWKHLISISKWWYRKQSFTRSPEYSFVSHHDVMKTSFSNWGIHDFRIFKQSWKVSPIHGPTIRAHLCTLINCRIQMAFNALLLLDRIYWYGTEMEIFAFVLLTQRLS